MSTLYGLIATHPTRVDCELLEQHERRIAAGMRAGRSVPAWGTAQLVDGRVATRLQRTPQPFSRRTRVQAQERPGHMALTWCPRPGQAVGRLQPLVEGSSMAVIRVSVPAGAAVRADIRDALRPRRRDALETDATAEYVFQLLLERRDQMPSRPPARTLRAVMWNVLSWSRRAMTVPSIGDGMQTPLLQILWRSGMGMDLVGCSVGAPLWWTSRTEPRGCGLCGRVHATRVEDDEYRATVIATEPLTEEEWKTVPDETVFSVSPTRRLEFDSTLGTEKE